MKDKLIIKPFNKVYFGFIGIYALFLVSFIQIHKNLEMHTRINVVNIFYIVAVIIYFIYKYEISIDDAYNKMKGFDTFNWFNELPLNVCNLVLILTPLGLVMECKPLLGMCFFASLILSPMALITPETGFENHYLFIPRIFRFYFSHFLAISSGFILYSFNLYRPVLKELPMVFLVMFIVSFFIYCINKVFRKTGINPKSNYYFNVDPIDNPILLKCWSLLPYEYLFTLPICTVFAVLCILLTFIINLF